MEAAIGRGKTFDGGYAKSISLDGEHIAGFHRFAVDEHGTSAALGGIATDVGACETLLLTQKLDQASV
jgi:hypothetical protein